MPPDEQTRAAGGCSPGWPAPGDKSQRVRRDLAWAWGFAIATQVHQTQSSNLDNLREDDLVRLLDQVQGDNSRLGDEIQALQTQRGQLETGVAGSAEARAAATQRLDSLRILAGTVKAHGPGDHHHHP